MKKLLLLLILFTSMQIQAQWSYSSRTDPMTGKTIRYATVNSLNKVELSYPYDGGTTVRLVIVGNIKRPTTIIFEASKGQLVYNGYVSMKLDYSNPFNMMRLGFVTRGKYNVMGVSPISNRLIKRLKESDFLMVELPFYHDGKKIFKFDVTGFKWNF